MGSKDGYQELMLSCKAPEEVVWGKVTKERAVEGTIGRFPSISLSDIVRPIRVTRLFVYHRGV